MAKQEYFIDDDSKRKSTATYSTLIHAHNIPPVYGIEKGTAIKVFQKDDFEVRERTFAFAAILDGDVSTTPITIADGMRYMTSDLRGIIFRDNMFPVALSWKTRTGDDATLVGIFYDDTAAFRYNGVGWTPVGPASAIYITSSERTGNSAAYQVSYNHFQLAEAYGCRLIDSSVLYYEAFGVSWLANALEYRHDYKNANA